MNGLTRNVYVISKMIGKSKKTGQSYLQVSYIELDKIINSQKESKFVGFIVKTAFLDVEKYDNVEIGNCTAYLEFNDNFDKFTVVDFVK